MVAKPQAFLLHGFLGVGKTTFAKRLEREQAAVRFTHDEWMSRLYGSNPPAAHFQDYADRVFGTMETIWTRCLELGTNVVLDYGFWSRAERAHVRGLVLMHGGEPVLYRFNCPSDIAMKRVSERNGQPGAL
jgi:predicted kinase